jgi:hypothetical protein
MGIDEAGGIEMELRFVVSHPSRKNKNAVRVGHPEFVVT